MRFYGWIQIVPVLALLVTMAGCGDGDDNLVPVVGEASLRVIHGSPDAPPVDVLVDGSVALTDVLYLAASDYLAVPAGEHNVQVRAAGTDTVVIDADVVLDADTDYTVVATGLVASIAPVVLVDDRTLPGAGSTKVRIGHGAPSAPSVDVYVTAPGGDLVAPALVDVPFPAFSAYLTVPAGDYRVRVTPTGSTAVVIDTGTITLPSNGVFTAIAVDSPGGGAPFGAELYADIASSTASIRFIHATPILLRSVCFEDAVLTDISHLAVS